MLGTHTLDDLHWIIFEAFNRDEEHLWEFQVGGKSRRDVDGNIHYGVSDIADEDNLDASATTLNSLNLKPGSTFWYIFDFGDEWEHSITVTKIEDAETKKMEPRIAKRTGKAPPQYSDR